MPSTQLEYFGISSDTETNLEGPVSAYLPRYEPKQSTLIVILADLLGCTVSCELCAQQPLRATKKIGEYIHG